MLYAFVHGVWGVVVRVVCGLSCVAWRCVVRAIFNRSETHARVLRVFLFLLHVAAMARVVAFSTLAAEGKSVTWWEDQSLWVTSHSVPLSNVWYYASRILPVIMLLIAATPPMGSHVQCG